jgi:hypothetical protein
VEGVNLGGFMIIFGAMILGGVMALVALVLLIARQTTPARIVFASGLLAATVITALGVLTFFDRQFHHEGDEGAILFSTLILLLAGVSQFIAAVRNPRAYAAAFGCAAGALAYGTVAGMAGSDILYPAKLPAGAGVSLLLAVASLMIAVLPPSHRRTTLLWSGQALLGGIAGYNIGGACVMTRCQVFEPPGRELRAHVEVYVLGVRVSDEVGPVDLRDPADHSVAIRAISAAQDAWVYGVSVAGAIAGIVAALGIAAALVKPPGEPARAEPPAATDAPHEHSLSRDHIKPA